MASMKTISIQRPLLDSIVLSPHLGNGSVQILVPLGKEARNYGEPALNQVFLQVAQPISYSLPPELKSLLLHRSCHIIFAAFPGELGNITQLLLTSGNRQCDDGWFKSSGTPAATRVSSVRPNNFLIQSKCKISPSKSKQIVGIPSTWLIASWQGFPEQTIPTSKVSFFRVSMRLEFKI